MAEDRIDSIIDRPAVQAEIDATKKDISDLIALIKSTKGTAIEISGAKSVSEYTALNAKLQENINLTKQAADAVNGQGTAIKNTTTARNQENLSLQQNIELRKRLQTSLASYLADQKEDAALLKEGTITRAEYNKRITESTVKIEQYKNRIKEINTTITQQTRTEKQLATERQRNARIEQEANNKQIAILQKSIAQINKQSGAYAKLSAEYNDVALAAKNFNITLGANNPLTIAATRNALELGNRLKEVDATVGQNQRSVGDYTNSITKAAGSAFGAIRKIAYVLPGIGIAGIFSAIFDGIGAIFSSGNSKLDTLARDLKEKITELVKPIEDIRAAAVEGSAGDIATVNALATAVLDQTKSYKERNNALNQLKEINKSYFGDLSVETAALGGLKTAVDDYTNAIIASAVVKAFSDEIGKVSVELSNQISEYNKAGKAVDDYARKLEAAQKVAKVQGSSISGAEGGGAAEASLGGVQDAQADLTKAQSKLKIYSNSISLLSGQMGQLKTAIQGAVNQSLQFKPLTETKPGKDNSAALRKAAKDAKAEADARLKAERDIQAVRLQQEIDFNKEILNGDSIHFQDRFEALIDYETAKKALINLNADTELQLGEKNALELQLVEVNRDDELLRLKREVNTNILKLQKDVHDGLLKGEEKLRDDLAKIAEDGYKKWKEIEDKKAADRKKKEEDEKKDAEELKKKKLELEKQLAKELTDLAFTFITANLERRKNALQDQMNELEIQKAREIELAGGNANAIAVIEARAQIQKEALQRKQRELDIKKAQFDKAQAIARIIQETAIGIVANLKTPQLIPLVIAIGAAQLAAVIATPIPRYKDGGKHPGGPMVVGDGGRPEGIVFPDGTTMKTPATATLMNAPAGTVIHKDFNEMMFSSTATKPVVYKQPTTTQTDSSVKVVKGLKAVEKAIGKIPQTSITVQNPLRTRVRYGHSINEHLKRNLGK